MESGHEASQPPASPAVAQFIFGRFRLDVAARQLFRDDEAVALSAKAWETLHLLISHRHRVVGKEELLGFIWPQKTVSEDLLPQNILAIRRALGDDSGQPKFIATTPKRGYRFVAAVTVVHVQAQAAAAPAAVLEADVAPIAPVDTTVVSSPVTDPHAVAPPLDRPRGPTWRLPVALAAIAAVIAAVIVARTVYLRSTPFQPSRPLRFTQAPPQSTSFASGGVLSPDGRHLAFVAQDDGSGRTDLWVRTLDATEAHAITGTEDAMLPFWSPDSQSLGFFSHGKLKRVGLTNDPPQTLADVGLTPSGGTWNAHGLILFAGWKAGLKSVSDTGGRVSTVTTLSAATREAAHQRPQFLPDGRHFLYFVSSPDPGAAGTYVGSLDSPDRNRVADVAATYALPGYLLIPRDGALMAQGFDAGRLRVTSAPVRIASDVRQGDTISSAGGDLLAIGGRSGSNHLIWFDRAGRTVGTLDTPASLHNLAFSSDRKQLLASSYDAEQRGVWLIDLERGAPLKFAADGTSPWASPDGQGIVYTSDRAGGVEDVYFRPRSGRGEEELVLRTPENKIVNDWSPDGRYIVYVSTNPSTKKDIWLLPRFGSRTPVPYLQTPFNEIQGQVSPDGRWMAYASDESGTWQVYVQSFPTPGRKRAISVTGGAQPRWRDDGRELFYLASDHTLMGVEITLGDVSDPGQPRALFKVPVVGTLNAYRSHYAVTHDGQRFLVDSVDASQRSISLLVNWNVGAKP